MDSDFKKVRRGKAQGTIALVPSKMILRVKQLDYSLQYIRA